MNSAPACIGIILDGNRRWAKARGLGAIEGHQAGRATFKAITKAVQKRGIEHLVVYLFSRENWKREETEVRALMELFREAILAEMTELGREGARVHFVGERNTFSKSLQEAMSVLEEGTAHTSGFELWFCMPYSGRAEIVAAARSATENGEEITEESLERHLWTAGMPDPDLIIRTSGEKRLSGFLPWQSVYSELFFTDTLWPDFSEDELDTILTQYAERERRRGK